MKIFVLGRERPGQAAPLMPASVGTDLLRLFEPLFSPRPTLSLRSVGAARDVE
jgi:hypothetical protein